MGEPESDHVARMLGQDLVPHADRAPEVAGDPVPQRSDVRPLPGGGTGHVPLRQRGRLLGGGPRRGPEGQHREIALEAVRKPETRVRLEQPREALRQVGPVGKVSRDQVGEGALGTRGAGGDR